MKPNQARRSLSLIMATLLLLAPSLVEAKGSAIVTFENPEEFTDIEMGSITSEKDRNYVTGLLEKTFTKGAAKNLPDGFTIKINVKDVDLAGDHDPRFSHNQDIRIYKDIYWPRIEFEYQILNAEGATIAQSETELKNLSYTHDISIGHRKITHYTDRLIKDWMSRDIKKILKES